LRARAWNHNVGVVDMGEDNGRGQERGVDEADPSTNVSRLLAKRASERPYLIFPGLLAILNGYWHRLKFILLLKKVRIGRGLRVYGSLNISGPGSVTIGDNCVVQSRLFGQTSFITRYPNSRIEIGNDVGFNGTSIQCFTRVTIEDLCAFGDAYLVDSQSHFLSADRRLISEDELPKDPVRIGRNVWVSTKVVITQGVHIGENCVIGAFSLVRHDLPANGFYAGIPARFVKGVQPTRKLQAEQDVIEGDILQDDRKQP
jgi:acetyltransferase-like isoleucine patch superfamily enzyme